MERRIKIMQSGVQNIGEVERPSTRRPRAGDPQDVSCEPGLTGLRRSITELKGRHAGADIWLIAAGPSLNYVAPAFFEGKVTLGVNDVYRRFPCSYLVRRTRLRAEKAY